MSLFDPPKQENLSETFPPGTLFWLLGAKFEGVQPTAYGDSPQAAVVVCPVGEEHNAKQLRVWGTLAEQVAEMEDSDVPAEVEIAKQGRKNVWKLSKKLDHLGVSQQQVTDQEEPPY